MITISDTAKVIAAFETETIKLMKEAESINEEMRILQENHYHEMKRISQKHENILTRIAANESTVIALLKDAKRHDF